MIIGWVDRRVHHPGQTSDSGGDAEHDGKPAVDVDSQQAHGFAIRHASTYNHAKSGEAQEREDASDHDNSKEEVDDAPNRIDNIHAEQGTDIGNAVQRVRGRCLDGVGAVEIFDHFLQHNRQAKGHQNLVRMRAFVEVFDQAAFHHKANGDHDWEGEQNGQWNRPVDNGTAHFGAEPAFDVGGFYLQRVAQKVGAAGINRFKAEAEKFLYGHSTKGADHEQRAMRKVHNAKRAKDQCEAKRNQRIGRALVEPI